MNVVKKKLLIDFQLHLGVCQKKENHHGKYHKKTTKGDVEQKNMLYIQPIINTNHGKERLSKSTGFRLDEKSGVEKASQ